MAAKRHVWTFWLVVAAAVCVTGCSIAACIELYRVTDQIRAAAQLLPGPRSETMATLETSWISGGKTTKVTTIKADGETDAQHSTRHAAAVAAHEKNFHVDE